MDVVAVPVSIVVPDPAFTRRVKALRISAALPAW
jgi:hypothetical protein